MRCDGSPAVDVAVDDATVPDNLTVFAGTWCTALDGRVLRGRRHQLTESVDGLLLAAPSLSNYVPGDAVTLQFRASASGIAMLLAWHSSRADDVSDVYQPGRVRLTLCWLQPWRFGAPQRMLFPADIT